VRRHRVAIAILLTCGGAWFAFVLERLGEPLVRGDLERLSVSALGFEVFLGAVAFAGAALSGGSPGARLGLGRSRLSVAETAALVVGTVALSYALYGLLDLSGWKERSALGELETELVGLRGRGLVLAVLSLGVGAGVAEELLCRGLVQRGLVPRLGAPAGIALASAFFGLLHVEAIHAAFATFLGLYLGIAAYLGASTRTAIACHVMNNLGAVLAPAYGASTSAATRPAAIAVGFAVALAALLWVRRRAAAAGRAGGPVRSPAHS